jgi:hypothetical protein
MTPPECGLRARKYDTCSVSQLYAGPWRGRTLTVLGAGDTLVLRLRSPGWNQELHYIGRVAS